MRRLCSFAVAPALLLLAAPLAIGAEAAHETRNPVYRDLLATGVEVEGEAKKLPAPTLADGLSPAEQAARIEELGGSRYPLAKLTRKSVVAPQIVRVPTRPAEAGVALRTVDVWFVVHADLEVVADPEFLGKLLNSQEGDGQATGLTAAQLQARGISIAAENVDWEGFGHVAYDLLDKVRIDATGRSFWSRSSESIVGAVRVDHRFLNDEEFPNQWRPLKRSGKSTEAGQPLPYDGVGFYVKITKMHQPDGALFVEYHLVFAEPTEWFRGTNQLGAKLPAVMQSQVRSARREMMTASRRGSGG